MLFDSRESVKRAHTHAEGALSLRSAHQIKWIL